MDKYVNAAKFDLLVERFNEARERGDIEAMNAELRREDYLKLVGAKGHVTAEEAFADCPSQKSAATVALAKAVWVEHSAHLRHYIFVEQIKQLTARVAELEARQ